MGHRQRSGRSLPDIVLLNLATNLSSAVGGLKGIYSIMPPINLAYLAAALEQEGAKVEIIDEAAEGLTTEAVVLRVKESGTAIVGMPILTQLVPHAEHLIRSLRSTVPDVKIVLGNLHASLFAEDYLKRGLADVVISGEGEITIVELLKALLNHQPLASIQGIFFLQEGKLMTTPPRPYIEDLDQLPFPAWHLFPLDRYALFSFARVRTPGTLILGSRGCPYNCSFCSLLVMGSKRRKRSLENILEEFEWLHETFGYRQISFIDPIFPLTEKEGFAFCELLMKKGLHKKVVWTTETRVDLVSLELLQAMRVAGCRRVMYGFEAGDDVTLSNIKQRVTTLQASQAARWTREAGMEVIGFFMLGVPGETKLSAEKTVQFACQLPVDFAKFNLFVPYPGTRDYEQLKAEGKLEGVEWERYTSYPTSGNPPSYLPDGWAAEELMQVQRRAVLRFYLRPKCIARHLFQIRTIPFSHLAKGAAALAGFAWSSLSGRSPLL